MIKKENLKSKILDFLEHRKYKAFSARNAKSAAQILKTEDIDLILMDINMPDISGHELTKKLKSLDQFRSIPVIYCSSNAQ